MCCDLRLRYLAQNIADLRWISWGISRSAEPSSSPRIAMSAW